MSWCFLDWNCQISPSLYQNHQHIGLLYKNYQNLTFLWSKLSKGLPLARLKLPKQYTLGQVRSLKKNTLAGTHPHVLYYRTDMLLSSWLIADDPQCPCKVKHENNLLPKIVSSLAFSFLSISSLCFAPSQRFLNRRFSDDNLVQPAHGSVWVDKSLNYI